MAKGNMMGGSSQGNYSGYPGGSMGSRIPFRPNQPPGPGNVQGMGNGPMLGTGGDPYWSQDAVRRRGGNTGVFGGPNYGSGMIQQSPMAPKMGFGQGMPQMPANPGMMGGRMQMPNQMPRVPMTNPQPIQGPGYATGGGMAPQFDMSQLLKMFSQSNNPGGASIYQGSNPSPYGSGIPRPQ